MVNYKEFYINNKPKPGKTRCCEEELNNSIDCNGILPQQLGEYLKIKNHLSEYNTKADRELVLANLGIDARLTELDASVDERLQELSSLVDEKIEELNNLEDELNQKADDMHNELYDRVPIYSSDLLERKPKDIDKYLIIPSISDLEGESVNHTVTSIDGTYLDLLFRTIRALLSEVAKLKNSFRFGINSYKDDNTAMSESVHDIEDIEEEPLWAIDPEALSFLDLVTIDENHSLKGYVDSGTKGVLKILSSATWESKDVSDNPDTKIVFYLTVSNPKISIIFEDLDNNTFNLDLLNIISSLSLLDIMIIVSRETDLGGKNYIYINSNNKNLDREIVSGYYSESNSLSISPYYITLNLRFKLLLLRELDLYKLNVYSKYLDFSEQIIPAKPNDSSYKLEASHITIRSVEDYNTLLELAKYLLDSELVYCRSTKRLYIIDNGKIQGLGGTSSSSEDDNEMTSAELIQELLKLGIVTYEDGDLSLLSLNDISDITFINEDTKDKFKVTIDAYGQFKVEKVYTNNLESRMEGRTFLDYNVRGLVATLKGYEKSIDIKKDFGLSGDRIKIGAIYAPLDTDKVFGCTHGYIELENTSDEDFPLDGCYLHMCLNHPTKSHSVYHLALSGIIPAGGTYLIRCMKYAEPTDPNVFINVDTFDIEWYDNNRQLLDLTIYTDISRQMGFALTYLMDNLNYNTPLYQEDSTTDLPKYGLDSVTDKEAFPHLYHKYFIDSIYIGDAYLNSSQQGFWGSKNVIPIKSNSIFKNTFELDPAKLAFLATTGKESSRIRWANALNDYQLLNLDNEYIRFPKTDETYPISKFTPKASFLHKNVCTDKSKLNLGKPNMVTCSFGINIYTTRCFNWISGGLFDEYVFIKNLDQNKEWTKFASYGLSESDSRRKSFSENVQSIIYNRITGRFPADNTYFTSHKCIIDIINPTKEENGETVPNYVHTPTTYTYVVGRADKDGNPDFEHCSEEYTFTLYPLDYSPVIYQITDQQGFHWIEYQVWAAAANSINKQIDYNTKNLYLQSEADIFNFGLENALNYGVNLTSAQVDLYNAALNLELDSLLLYVEEQLYVDGDEIPEGKKVGDVKVEGTKLTYELATSYNSTLNGAVQEGDPKNGNDIKHIIPILINTGDMTLNGTRINEWLDYYNAGKCLFNHLEQMNVVGNNDLCGTNPEILGTGDDPGKSNGYYFHLFYCYEINPEIVPIVNGKYIPSLYYFDSKYNRYLMVNSEITYENCKSWFGLINPSDNEVANIYTGFTVPISSDNNSLHYVATTTVNFVPIYNLIYLITDTNKNIIAACHELPFTVITRESLETGLKTVFRSVSKADKLVGSHLNLLRPEDNKKGIYWFSRLMEYRGVKLVIGGHKHTYSCTYPLREYYYYIDNDILKNSKDDGMMEMGPSLENDTVNFNDDTKNLSKFPLTSRDDIGLPTDNITFYPYTPVGEDNLEGGIVYFMCQATGYKLTSNKELPSPDLKFSKIVPNTGLNNKGKDAADPNLKHPMFSIIDSNGIKLVRIKNILNESSSFSQFSCGTDKQKLEYLLTNDSNNHGTWGPYENYLININL